MTRARGRYFDPENTTGQQGYASVKRYRCVYCRKIYLDVHDLSAHEGECMVRPVLEKQWALRLEQARRLERQASV